MTTLIDNHPLMHESVFKWLEKENKNCESIYQIDSDAAMFILDNYDYDGYWRIIPVETQMIFVLLIMEAEGI